MIFLSSRRTTESWDSDAQTSQETDSGPDTRNDGLSATGRLSQGSEYETSRPGHVFFP